MEPNEAAFTVLVVEDSSILRPRLVGILGELGARVVVIEAADPASATQAFRSAHPDAVVLDLSLRGGSGFDVLREIRRAPDSTLVIVFTNHTEEPYRRRCLEGGADFFFDKSKDLPRMLEVLRERAQLA
jgi:CheY-like chemotaxis protein